MFVLDKGKKRISKIQPSTFSELGIKERRDLQEWLANNTEAFGEELLIIQKEFAGFEETKERLDLLAIDKQGNLVLIENKLDDSGKDVTWQALKYASYCSSLTKSQIKDIYQNYIDKLSIQEVSEQNICEFMGTESLKEVTLNQIQRIILVSNIFRKEVTSTVLWLLNNYNLKIQCFKATPYPYGEQVFLDIEQIIPVKEAEEYMISMAEKAKEEQSTQDELKKINLFRLEFWKLLLPEINKKSELFKNISPSKDAWLAASTGISSVGFHFNISKDYARSTVYMSRSISEENKFIFDKLYEVKTKIESQIKGIEWERLDAKKACRIKVENRMLSLYNKEDWPAMIEFMVNSMVEIEQVFNPLLAAIRIDDAWIQLTRGNPEV